MLSAEKTYIETPPCALEGQNPDWWDISTHTHVEHWPCTECKVAVRTCAGCPLRVPCFALGRQRKDPYMIYGGRAWNSRGIQSWRCEWCGNPMLAKLESRISTFCSRACHTNHNHAAKLAKTGTGRTPSTPASR